MKKNAKVFSPAFGLLFVLCMALNVSCAGGAEAAVGEPAASVGGATANTSNTAGQGPSEVNVFSGVEGKEWRLLELRSGGNTVRIDRGKIEGGNIADSFTIGFQEGRVSGVGWPNRYFGPYTASGDTLSVGLLASTQMAAFVELAELKEYDYLAYLAKVTRWAVRDGKLELYSTSDGRETVLVYEPR